MLKKLTLLLLVIAPMTIFAQDKIAHINANEIFSKMPELKEVETKLAALGETIKKNAAAIQAEYEAKVNEFSQTPSDSLTQSILIDRQTQLENLEKRYQEYIQKSQAEFEQERQKLFTPLEQKLRQAIKDVGDQNNYTYILDSATLLHIGSSAIDANKLVKGKLGITD
ncbi:MAG: OmpH family outer membrane protein [Dysgonomonas sp.]|nr:OmpH family outer membrane protein [Dysgonomonas sp.]